ncbi:hypothetical protein [Streptomonospora litoralis]|uniref:Uncharacterized protein n=1 Tax=Streptomonospora litoralis TaxID=2498135 RepID=A0A4V0ZJG1_9ACTN|nr:hypothetical protein [Streptomonospora litoralis]QBI53362.1 hypothetical protein EKD16_07830 [Streptomonospora litoralis]
MRPLRRTAGLPEGLRSRLALRRGERVLARTGGGDDALVATDRALHLPDGHVVPWEHIDRARWTEEGFTFTEEGHGRRVFRVDEPGRLAEVVYERVTATIVVTRHIPLEGPDEGRGFRLVARRPPGGSEISWQVHVDDGVDPQDPRVAERAGPALAALREQMGV